MSRYNRIFNEMQEALEADASQKTYKGKKRSALKDSDFLFPETRSFPIVSPQDVPDAISNFGRMKGQMSYEAFLDKLYKLVKRKGPEFVAALPESTKKQLGLKSTADDMYGMPPMMEQKDSELMNKDTKNEDEEEEDNEDDEDDEDEEEDQKEQKDCTQIVAEKGDETPETELQEYKQDFFQMSLGSIKSIAIHAQAILNAVSNDSVKEGLTESWLQGKIAVAEDYVLTIHNFLMFGETEIDTEGSQSAEALASLWENIRKKKERMGKNYRPAKPGDKDRPNPDAWKKAQS